MAVKRVVATQAACELIRSLRQEFGELIFHQSGGCCDGSAPMCFVAGEFRLGHRDVLLGSIEVCAFHIGGAQFEYWSHTQLIIDVTPGRGASFSLEIPRGVRFLTRSRVFTDEEAADLEPVSIG